MSTPEQVADRRIIRYALAFYAEKLDVADAKEPYDGPLETADDVRAALARYDLTAPPAPAALDEVRGTCPTCQSTTPRRRRLVSVVEVGERYSVECSDDWHATPSAPAPVEAGAVDECHGLDRECPSCGASVGDYCRSSFDASVRRYPHHPRLTTASAEDDTEAVDR